MGEFETNFNFKYALGIKEIYLRKYSTYYVQVVGKYENIWNSNTTRFVPKYSNGKHIDLEGLGTSIQFEISRSDLRLDSMEKCIVKIFVMSASLWNRPAKKTRIQRETRGDFLAALPRPSSLVH